MRRVLLILSVLAMACVTLWAIDWVSLNLMETNAAARAFVMTPEFTALALIGGIVVALAPVIATACLIRSARPTGRNREPGGQEQ